VELSDSVNNLMSDIEYLVHEIQALQPLTDEIPLKDKPVGESSIAEILCTIHKNQGIISELIAQIINKGGEVNLNDSIFMDYVDLSNEELKQFCITYTLEELIESRVSFIKDLKSRSQSFFSVESKNGISLYHLLEKFLDVERNLMKKIGEIVMVIQSERQFQRELRIHRRS